MNEREERLSQSLHSFAVTEGNLSSYIKYIK